MGSPNSGSSDDILELGASNNLPDPDNVRQRAAHTNANPKRRKIIRPVTSVKSLCLGTWKKRKQRSLKLTNDWKNRISAFIRSESEPNSPRAGSDEWKEKLLTFLRGTDFRVHRNDINRWVRTHRWIMNDALAKEDALRTQQLEQNQNQNQIQNLEHEVLLNQVIPQGDIENDSDQRKFEDCTEVKRCILALKIALSKRDEFRSTLALFNFGPMLEQIACVEKEVFAETPRE